MLTAIAIPIRKIRIQTISMNRKVEVKMVSHNKEIVKIFTFKDIAL